ncbi:MAG: hypothetical protein ACOYL6_13880 [Bacteriovoracaceae bacterium]
MKTTGIGSLPHHNVDSALNYSFRHDLPFLPQLPLKNPAEMMVFQTLFGFPGLELIHDKPILNLKKYVKTRNASMELLEKSLHDDNYEAFLPTPTEYSAFAPFIFELQERNSKEAKVQISGHLTNSLVLSLEDGESLKDYPQILSDIFKWTMVKGLALIQVLKKKAIKPVIFIDEPILTIFKSSSDPLFITGISELTMLALCFRKNGAVVGMHSCGNALWKNVLDLPLDYLSFDCKLSTTQVLQEEDSVNNFLKGGGKLSLGLLPTQMFDQGEAEVNPEELLRPWEKHQNETLLTCACGLGLKTPEKAELFLSLLNRFKLKDSCK